MSRGTKAIVNLDNLNLNYQKLKEKTSSKLILVVKADAYGHGLKQIVQSLGQVDCYAVATIKEAEIIRKCLPKVRILLLEGFLNQKELIWALENSVEFVIHQQQQIDLLLNSNIKESINLWLKIDTGMNRLGFKPNKFEQKLNQLLESDIQFDEITLMSHFANANNSEDEFNLKQIDQFKKITKNHQFARCFSNTSAFLNGFDNNEDWVRIGLGLFGVSPVDGKKALDFGLKPVMTLQSKIIEIKSLIAGEGIGYGQKYQAKQDKTIAIIGIGYGDGYPWVNSEKNYVLINGKKAKVIGSVSMDMIAVDVTDIQDAKIGQNVLIWGQLANDCLLLETVAENLSLIPYVLLCGITSRVEYEYQ